jgi:modulator of FtsH protease
VGDWTPFFAAQVGASAALTGLVFVALSINLASIIAAPQLVHRAAEALIVLVAPVLVGLAVLVPWSSRRSLGIGVLVVGVVAAAFVNTLLLRGRVHARGRPVREFRIRVTAAELAVLPAVVGGVMLIAGSVHGLRAVALGTAFSIAAGMVDAWVLLVEILR